jgi:hypothetical protein
VSNYIVEIQNRVEITYIVCSEQFNCTPVNPYPERCGVPFSCCRRAVVSEAGGNVNPLAPAIRSLQCWQNAQRKPEQDLENDIHTAGCLQPMRALFDKHAVHMGMAVVAIILPVVGAFNFFYQNQKIRIHRC